MYGLTKENFFDEMSSKYPQAMIVFNDWIDTYKTASEWNKMFNEGYEYQHYKTCETETTAAPKFHELPFEMQFGMIAYFMSNHERMFRHMPCKPGAVRHFFERCLVEIEDKKGRKSVEQLQELDLKNIDRHGQSNNV